jgi:hypothetical protein
MISSYSTNNNSASFTHFLLIPLFHFLPPTTSQPLLALLVDLYSHLLISSTTFWPSLYFPPKGYIKSLFPPSSFLSPSDCIHQYSSLVTTLNPSNIINSYYQPPWVYHLALLEELFTCHIRHSLTISLPGYNWLPGSARRSVTHISFNK